MISKIKRLFELILTMQTISIYQSFQLYPSNSLTPRVTQIFLKYETNKYNCTYIRISIQQKQSNYRQLRAKMCATSQSFWGTSWCQESPRRTPALAIFQFRLYAAIIVKAWLVKMFKDLINFRLQGLDPGEPPDSPSLSPGRSVSRQVCRPSA